MKIEQLTNTNTSVIIPTAAYDIHIGIEHLYSHPFIYPMITTPYPIGVSAPTIPTSYSININDGNTTKTYMIGKYDILEFNDEDYKNKTISVNANLLDDTTFVTIAYNITENG